MRIRALSCTVLVCILLFTGAPPQRVRVQAFVDNDRDTIDDNLEFQLAWQFYPTVWISNADMCPNPNPRPVLFRARHPSVYGNLRTNLIVISFIQLYDEDCAPIRHNGDNEPFEVWLQWNGSSWQWGSVSAVAHWDTGFERMTWSYSPELWVGTNKHGTYADPNQCGLAGEDECGGLARVFPIELYNVGEPYQWLLNELGQVRSYWWNERVWDDNQFLSAGHIRPQLYHNKYYSPFRPPLPYNCAAHPNHDCWDTDGMEWVPPGSNPPPPLEVVFYEHIHFEGAWFSGTTDIPFVGWDWNDRISSINIPPGRTVVLYEHIDFGGLSITVTSDVWDIRDLALRMNWNDQVSSIRIY